MKKLVARLGTALITVLASLALAAPATAAPTSGINDWTCQPSAAHPEPVVLWHGLGSSGDVGMALLSQHLKRKGYCVYYKTYGTTHWGPFTGGLASMRESAAELDAFVEKVRASTGAAKVSIAGHSEGTTVPAYYLKFLGGDEVVRHFVGFGSNFKGTSYTSIVTKYDEVVTPYTSGILAPASNVKNIVLQDVCALDLSGHVGLAWDPNVFALVANALDPANARPVNCVPMPWLS